MWGSGNPEFTYSWDESNNGHGMRSIMDRCTSLNIEDTLDASEMM
jgi:hypothetical protein